MARFYAIRYKPNGKLLVQQHVGVGMKYIPIARDAGDVTHLQHLVVFKTLAAAVEFIEYDLWRICDDAWNAVLTEQLIVVALDVLVAEG